MNILAFDTSGSFLSTGLRTPGGFFEENRLAGLKHSEHLLPDIDNLMKKAELDFSRLDLIVCSRGPGSFTGLRIGMSTAKGLAAGHSIPLVSVSSLDVMAHGLGFFDGAVLPIIDAKKNRFYTAVYSGGERKSEYLDISAEDLFTMLRDYKKLLLTGPDCLLFSGMISDLDAAADFEINTFKRNCGCSSSMIEIGEEIFTSRGADPENSGPMYIRLSDAELARKEKK